MNQIVAAAALFGAATLVLAPLAAESGRQIGSNSQNIADMMEDSRQRSGEVLVRTWMHVADGTTALYLSSIGQQEVRVAGVMINGTAASYRLLDQDSAETTSLEPGSLGVLLASGTGAVQITSERGKLFEFGP